MQHGVSQEDKSNDTTMCGEGHRVEGSGPSGDLAEVLGNETPAVVAQTGEDLVLLLTSEVLDRCRGSVGDLKGRIKFYASMKQLEAPF